MAKAVAKKVTKQVKEETNGNSVGVLAGFYHLDEAAKQVGISKQTLTNLIAAGKIKATKFGRIWVIQEDELAKVESVRGGNRSRIQIQGVIRLPFTCPHCESVIESIEDDGEAEEE